ncbi:MAG TPA: methylenetetrahydrofolate reductase [Thermoanaerobaculia bacterium]|nr:methylenetetrahydrofolate reductase [Thermoanaerobaculia bacterium]
MKVIEHLARATEPLISFEIIPPLRGGDLGSLLAVIEALMPFHPPFIDITSHSAQVIYEETPQGIRRKVKRKRPGTLGVCALLQNKHHVDAVPHILCQGFTREETEDFLIELNYLGIDNVMALRGDDSGYKKPLKEGRTANETAIDLVTQITDMNHGRYIEDDLLDASPTHFCVGVAGYPERHVRCPNMKAEVKNVKDKLAAGAEYVVTQMFFDNAHYFRYLEMCQAEGITAPIVPGLKILTSKRQLTTIPQNFYAEIPWELSDEIEKASPEHVAEVGVEWAARQSQELLDHGVPSLHYYVMQESKAITALLGQLKL